MDLNKHRQRWYHVRLYVERPLERRHRARPVFFDRHDRVQMRPSVIGRIQLLRSCKARSSVSEIAVSGETVTEIAPSIGAQRFLFEIIERFRDDDSRARIKLVERDLRQR